MGIYGNLRASVVILTKVSSESVCWVGWELVCRHWGSRVCGGFLLWLPGLASILWEGGLDTAFFADSVKSLWRLLSLLMG